MTGSRRSGTPTRSARRCCSSTAPQDANSGTYPIQSQRLFDAIRANGGTARLVVLPHESHAYLARESVLHVLAEQFGWLERWLGPAPARQASQEAPVSLSGRATSCPAIHPPKRRNAVSAAITTATPAPR